MFEDIIAHTDIPKRTDFGDIPRYNAPENKTLLYGEQSGYCNGCGTHFEKQHLEVDYIIAENVGGTDHKEINMQNEKKSIETMEGVLLSYKEGYQSEKKDYSLKILIDNPFNAKINIEIDTDEWNKYINYSIDRKWRGILDSHPEECNNGHCYFNIQEREFYMASTMDDKGNPIWQRSTLKEIVYTSYRAMDFRRHIGTDYNRYHVGQRCKFRAYAIDANDNLYKPSSIDKDFHKYQWIFYPTTFTAHEITSESVEHLITKMQIPELVADRIIQKCKSEKKRSQKKARRQWKIKVKTTYSNLWKRFMKQEPPINIMWKGVAIINGIIAICIAIWALFFKDK